MHKIVVAAIAAFLAFPGLADEADTRLEESRALSAELGKQLKARLMEEMQRAGPLAAIDVCNIEAPVIASEVSGAKVRVGRTALKIRNPDNAPTPEQQAVMESFAEQLLGGNVPEHFLTRGDGSAEYLRAIPMDAACATCHGPSLSGPVQKKIDALYPDDEATGFASGELRGAFVVSWPAPN